MEGSEFLVYFGLFCFRTFVLLPATVAYEDTLLLALGRRQKIAAISTEYQRSNGGHGEADGRSSFT